MKPCRFERIFKAGKKPAHALELPGKVRLSKEHYLAVQPINYPGFTIRGMAEHRTTAAAMATLSTTRVGAALIVAVRAGAGLAVIWRLAGNRL